jgi:hypothetical protein
MNSLALAKDYLRKATARLHALDTLYQEQSYDDVVREAQEIVELVLKGVLRCVGIDPPRRHDVAPVLRVHQDRLPASWQKNLEWIEEVSLRLFRERAEAFYGDEGGLVPASELFDEEDATQALTWARDLVQLYDQLLAELPQPVKAGEGEDAQKVEEAEEHEPPE